jgi:hypothetical protein
MRDMPLTFAHPCPARYGGAVDDALMEFVFNKRRWSINDDPPGLIREAAIPQGAVM